MSDPLLDDIHTLPLLEYLSHHPYPAYVLPSPRLSASSTPSLKPLWSNRAATQALGESLESYMNDIESQSLLNLTTSRDERDETDDDLISTEAGIGSGNCSGSGGSIISLNNKIDDPSFPLTLFSPIKMNEKQTFRALLIPSGHPSFLILQLSSPPKSKEDDLSRRASDTDPSAFAHLPPPNLAAANHSSVSSRGSRSSRVSKKTSSSALSSLEPSHNSVVLHHGRHAKTPSGPLGSTFSGSGSVLSRLTNGTGPSGSFKSGSFQSIKSSLSVHPSLPSEMVEEEDAREDETADGAEGEDDGMSQDDGEGEVESCESLLASTDWSQTPLGPRDEWPGSLKGAVSICLKMPSECSIWWGPELTMIYNDAYTKTVELVRDHPQQFGKAASVGWGKNRKEYQSMADQVIKEGKSMMKDDDLVFLGGQETYHTWRWSPLSTEDGSVAGLMINSFETTKNVLRQRWLTCLRDLSARITSTRNIKEYSEGVLRALESNPIDFSFAYFYHATEIDISAQASSSSIYLQLAGTLAVPPGHSSAPQVVNLNHRRFDASHPPTASQWPFREAFMTQRNVHIPDLDPSLVDALEHRSWGEPPSEAVCIPICETFSSGRLVFLVVGLNTRRSYDEDYRGFLHDLRANLSGHLKSIASFEAEILRISALEAMDQAKTAFFTSISHELKTPLTLIKGPLTDLAETETNSSRRKQLALALRNTARLARLIDSLMDFSRIEAGRMQGHFRPFDLGRLTVDLATLFRSAIEGIGKSGQPLTYDVVVESAEGKRRVYIDRDLYEKILFNVIGNSFKYTLEGFIHVAVHYTDDGVEVIVSDSGVGIPKSELELVFERFHRVSSSARSIEGTGIGLSLTSELVHLHGAQISLESCTASESPDGAHGSTFTIRFPYGKDHLPPAQTDDSPDTSIGGSGYAKGIIEEAGQWKRGASSVTSADSGVSVGERSSRIDINSLLWDKGDTILVADDSTDLRLYIRSILAPFCKIIEASDGNEALKLAKECRPDLILSDVSMPSLSGYQLLNALKLHPTARFIPLILLTAQSGDEERVNGLLAGASDYIAKPFSAKELIARSHLQMILGKNRIELETKFAEQLKANQYLTEKSPVGIVRVDHEGHVNFLNDSFYRQSGHPRNANPDDWTDSIQEDHREAAASAFATLLDGSGASLEFRWSGGGWCVAQAVLLSTTQSATTGMLITFTDITDRKRLEDERRIHLETEEAHRRKNFEDMVARAEEAEERRAAAEERTKQQELLMDVTSHEMRNPCSTILQNAGLCKDNLAVVHAELKGALESGNGLFPTASLVNMVEEDLDGLDAIVQMGSAMERIASDVLSLARIQLNSLDVFRVEVDLRRELQRLYGMFKTECRLNRIHLELEFGPTLQALQDRTVILVDGVRLSQVLINLLSNAIRFTSLSPTRNITFGIEIRAEPPVDDTCLPPPTQNPADTSKLIPESDVWLYAFVRDSGPGLTASELSSLFQKFRQASSETHARFGGSGLGLYVARAICQLMDGAIEVSSEKGEGSTFRFHIKVGLPALAPADPVPPVGYVSRRPSAVGTSQPLDVLIVEDNILNQRVLIRQLSKAGFTTAVASDGAEALELLVAKRAKGDHYDVILLDLEMPIMGGLECIREIRKLEEAGELIPRNLVFALTGNARQVQIDGALAAGMDDVFIKPYRIDSLLARLREIDI